jgi:putative copper resistance protein D
MLIALLIITRTVQIAGSILLAGIFTFDLVMLAPDGRLGRVDFQEIERRLLRLAVWSLVAALLSALLWFWLEVASMNGLSLTNAFSPTAWQTVLFETQFGRVWQLRLSVIAVVFALVASGLAQDQVRRTLIFFLWLLSIVLLVSLVWIGHAGAVSARPLGVLGDALHLCAAGAWLGGLTPLAIFLRCTSVSSSLDEQAAPVLARFSTLSVCCVGVLFLSGISNSWLLVGSIHALFTTPYGRFLLFKVTLFAILVALGARNRFLVKAKLLKARANPDLLSQLRRNVLCEICLGVAVVAIVGCLGVTPPARH